MTREAAVANGTLRGAIHELQGSGLRRAWLRWRQWRGSRKTKLRAVRHWAALAARERLMRGALAALTLRSLRAALNTMAAAAAERLAAVQLMSKSATALRQRGLRAAYNGWLGAAAERAAALGQMSRAAAALRQRGLLKAFNGWAGGAAERAEALERLRRSTAALTHRGQRGAFNRWLYELQRRERSGARQRACEKFAGRRALLRGFYYWYRNSWGSAADADDDAAAAAEEAQYEAAVAEATAAAMAWRHGGPSPTAAWWYPYSPYWRAPPGEIPDTHPRSPRSPRAPPEPRTPLQAVVHAQSLPSVGPPPTPPGWTPRERRQIMVAAAPPMTPTPVLPLPEEVLPPRSWLAGRL